MSDRELFHYRRLPARLNAEQAGLLLGFVGYEIGILMGLSLLRPLGKPSPNGHKFFCAAEIESLSKDREWLDKATRAIARKIQEKNKLASHVDEHLTSTISFGK